MVRWMMQVNREHAGDERSVEEAIEAGAPVTSGRAALMPGYDTAKVLSGTRLLLLWWEEKMAGATPVVRHTIPGRMHAGRAVRPAMPTVRCACGRACRRRVRPSARLQLQQLAGPCSARGAPASACTGQRLVACGVVGKHLEQHPTVTPA